MMNETEQWDEALGLSESAYDLINLIERLKEDG